MTLEVLMAVWRPLSSGMWHRVFSGRSLPSFRNIILPPSNYCGYWNVRTFLPDYTASCPRRSLHCKKVKESRNRPGVPQRVPGGSGSQISMTFGTWRWGGCHPHAPAALTPRKCSWYSFSLGAESTPGPWYCRKEYVTEKSSDTTGNRSQDRPTSSAAP
jgi:hypothetical protein